MLDYNCYGAIAEFFDLADPQGAVVRNRRLPKEILLDGPGGTGKTRGLLEWCNLLATQYPNTRIGIVRKTRASANDSWIPVFENHVLGDKHPAYKRQMNPSSRAAYNYPNRSTIVPLGMNNPTRLFSSEWHVLYVVEAIEFLEEDWEQLHRGLRAPAGPGMHLLVGDTNPGPKKHWLNQRCLGDHALTHRIRTAHSDNPMADEEYLSRLRQMTGNRYKRLYLGEWVEAEGLVWPTYDEEVNLITAKHRGPRHDDEKHILNVHGWGPVKFDKKLEMNIKTDLVVELDWFFGSKDFGFSPDPGSFEVWGVDAAGTAYMVAEVYRCGMSQEWWGKVIRELHEEFPMRAIAADHDKRFIQYLNHYLGKAGADGAPLVRNANKAGKAALLSLVEGLWRVDPKTGRAKAYICRDVLRHGVCPEIALRKAPTCFAEEIVEYTLQRTPDNVALPKPDPKCADHACDAAQYGLDYAFGRESLLMPRLPSRPVMPSANTARGWNPLGGGR